MEKEEITKFLKDFNDKLKVFNVIYRDERNKNLQTLAELEITPSQRTAYLYKLKAENYLSGPKKDRLNPGFPDYWEFGMKIKKKDVYIKISMGLLNKPIICISFHIAEYKLKYPLKKEE